jgi:activator of 2-hydroxyglutaryl-CoA dehydratase
LSVDAVQDKFVDVVVVPDAAKLVGAVGATLSVGPLYAAPTPTA